MIEKGMHSLDSLESVLNLLKIEDLVKLIADDESFIVSCDEPISKEKPL